MNHITTERVPILVWGELPDEGTLAQTRNLANLPFAWHHVALMADAHVGFGMPIGGVLAADGQVIPHAVGLDIGCGVRAWRTNVPAEELLPVREGVLGDIMRSVPQGFDWHDKSQAFRTDLFDDVPDVTVLRGQMDRAQRQIGSLGGGNHFLELQRDPDGVVWAMVHSGSRNLGKQMADHYDGLARDENRRAISSVPADQGLAHLTPEGEAGAEYLEVMGWCLLFARESRRLMADAVQKALDRRFPGVRPDPHVDVHHNYAAVETHYGRKVVVHRKGAVRARGTVVVPGSMGTASYIGEGLENPESFVSCSHGAGRAMGRRQAMRAISRDHVMEELEAARGEALQGEEARRRRGGPRSLQGHRGRDAGSGRPRGPPGPAAAPGGGEGVSSPPGGPDRDGREHDGARCRKPGLHVRPDLDHPWRVGLDEAAAIQTRLARSARLRPLPAAGPRSPRVVAGVDVAYEKDGPRAWAAAVAMDRAFRVVGIAIVEGEPDLPYVRGYLAFREGRLTVRALQELSCAVVPDLVFLDGHGVVHERGCGLATHVGVLLGVPTVGVPKTPFHAIDHLPGPRRGDFYVLTKEWGAQGASVRLKGGVKPVYVSPGMLTDLDSALALALAWSTGSHKVPEPLAAAHTLSVKARNAALAGPA